MISCGSERIGLGGRVERITSKEKAPEGGRRGQALTNERSGIGDGVWGTAQT